jgi:hypothetical protein
MKLAIAFHFQNELPWLEYHLPVWLKADGVDGVVAMDGGSKDGGADYVRSLGGTVTNRSFDFTDNGQEQNALIRFAEQCGYDAILHTAPDELWWPHQITQMKRYLESGKHQALTFPTYNFIGDRLHHAPYMPFHPDPHLRAWVLNKGHYYPDGLHTQVGIGSRWLFRQDCGLGDDGRDILYCPDIYLYHYADIKPRNQRDLLAVNRARGERGLTPLAVLPPDHQLSARPYCIPFTGFQPLDPHEIGANAPYGSPV